MLHSWDRTQLHISEPYPLSHIYKKLLIKYSTMYNPDYNQVPSLSVVMGAQERYAQQAQALAAEEEVIQDKKQRLAEKGPQTEHHVTEPWLY